MIMRKIRILIPSFSVLLCAALILAGCQFFAKPTLVSYPTKISCIGFYPGNYDQETTNAWLGCYNDKLYYSKRYYSRDYLYVFQDNELTKISELSSGSSTVTILGIVDNLFYYIKTYDQDYENRSLCCINLDNNQEITLYTGHLFPCNANYFASDGSIYIPLFSDSLESTQFQYVHILGQNVLGVKPQTEGYSLGTSMYFVLPHIQSEVVIETDLQGNMICDEMVFDMAYGRSIIPYESGLLVHNKRLNTLLYQITEDGDVKELFSIPCLASVSAVNVYGSDAYISVLRYEEYGEIGMRRYENDTVEGTYRINLTDGTTKKINDMCFDGIYNFDDTCFYCCDSQGNVYKMEFDGTTQTILKIE